MDVFAFKEGVRHTEAMEAAQFEQPLVIVIGFASSVHAEA